MLDELIMEISELKTYKKKYESATKDKLRMSELLFELMTEKYNNTPFEERKKHFKEDICRCCRWKTSCNIKIPEDIEKPIESDKAWIPAQRGCGEFEWD